jgi:hypothetical protein
MMGDDRKMVIPELIIHWCEPQSNDLKYQLAHCPFTGYSNFTNFGWNAASIGDTQAGQTSKYPSTTIVNLFSLPLPHLCCALLKGSAGGCVWPTNAECCLKMKISVTSYTKRTVHKVMHDLIHDLVHCFFWRMQDIGDGAMGDWWTSACLHIKLVNSHVEELLWIFVYHCW